MKSWFDLEKKEQKDLKSEFNAKRKVIDLRIVFYLLAIISAFPIIILIISMAIGECYENYCTINLIKSLPFFIIFLSGAIINSILISKKEEQFKSWLKTRNIEK